MESRFEMKQNWTFDSYKEANFLIQNKILKSFAKTRALSIGVFLIGMAGAGYLFLARGKISFVCLICGLFGLVLLWLVPFSFGLKLKDSWAASPSMDGYEEEIHFYDNYLEKSNSVTITKLEYERIVSIRECSGYVFLFISKQMAMALQKEQMPAGLPDYLRERSLGTADAR